MFQQKMSIIADTNIFYYLGNGSLKRSDLVSSSEELWATFISVREIISSSNKFSERVDAAKAMLAADNIAPNPDEYLKSLLEERLPSVDSNLKEICKHLVSAKDEQDLCRNIDIFFAVDERREQYEAFRCKLIHMCDKFVPGYADACWNKTQPPKFKKEYRKKFKDANFMLQLQQSMLQDYASGHLTRINGKNSFSKEQRTEASKLYNNYIAMYLGYAEQHLFVGAKPDINDWGDLELFKYMHSGHCVVTGEQKWKKIAESKGFIVNEICNGKMPLFKIAAPIFAGSSL